MPPTRRAAAGCVLGGGAAAMATAVLGAGRWAASAASSAPAFAASPADSTALRGRKLLQPSLRQPPAAGAGPAAGASAGLALGATAVGAVVAAGAARRRHAPGSAAARQPRQQGVASAVAMRGTPVCAGVVITGGAGGVGYAYADEFLKRGHRVVICDVKDPAGAVQALKEKYPEGSVYGAACDVSSIESVNKFLDFVKEKIRVVHYWVNNAGINGGRRRFTELSPETVEAVVKVNLVGVLLCTHGAMRMMQEQAGVTGHIFNTVGSGVKGGGTPGYVAYGATKRGFPQMTESLVKELEEGVQGYDSPDTPGNVCVHTLSPGMVFTDLLLNDSTPELRKFPFGVLAAQPEEVAADLVPKILGTDGNGKSVEFLTTDRIIVKFFERFILGKKSEYIDDDGNVIKKTGADYQDNGVRMLY